MDIYTKEKVKKITDELYKTLGSMSAKEADYIVAKSIVKLRKIMGDNIKITRRPVFFDKHDNGILNGEVEYLYDLIDNNDRVEIIE